MSPTRDLVVTIGLVGGFAALVTAHLVTVIGLARRHLGWRTPLAAVVAPLAPYWAVKRGMSARAIVWIAAAVIYLVALLLASK
jgi:hypothetical protein